MTSPAEARQGQAPFSRAFFAKILLGLAVAAAIAWVSPFDRGFGAVTFGRPAVRSAAIVVIALVGAFFGRRIGLAIEPRGVPRPILMPLAAAAATAVFCALCDWLMRSQMSAPYIRLLAVLPLVPRTAAFMMRAFNENIMYRLFLGSILIWLIGLVWKAPNGRPATGAYWTGFAIAQFANMWINVTSIAPLTPLGLTYDTLRYVTPAMVWSWLYWRAGFQSNEVACTSVHLFLQPMLQVLF